MANMFEYLLDKIERAPFSYIPFKHLEITNFLAEKDFREIVTSKQVQTSGYDSTETLLKELEANGYVIIPFPGCITSKDEYLKWFHGKSEKHVHEATESFGIVFRLHNYQNETIKQLNEFFESPELVEVVRKKFDISRDTKVDAGLQKYLHGYEISPHADIRRKALTWMLNINPGPDTENAEFHTHYLKPKAEFHYVTDFWATNPDCDRDWVPWSWCETVKRQRDNNSIVFFSPSDDTLHAVKADYDHLKTQRTQFYGNLWYNATPLTKISFKAFDIRANHKQLEAESAQKSKLKNAVKASAVGSLLRTVKSGLKKSDDSSIRKVKV